MQVIVATGFIASNPQGQVTTLRRNGSDYSATILGALFRGGHITIWTDVDGVYSADPRKVCLANPSLLLLFFSFLFLFSFSVFSFQTTPFCRPPPH